MITLDVFFTRDDLADGTVMLHENLITNSVQLHINNNIYIHELRCFINKAVNILKQRYSDVKVNIHWNTLKKEDE